MKDCIKNLLKKTVSYESILASIHDINSAFFNVKATFLHTFNFYFHRNLHLVEKLHFGCGNDYKSGYLNIDLARKADVFLDARNTLPFQEGQIEEIYSSHFLEHLTNHELIAHLKESYRVLKPQGKYRICLPDFRGAIDSYLGDDTQRFEKNKKIFPIRNHFIPEEYVTKLDYLDKALHENGQHKIYIDYPRILNILIFCGFDEDKINLSEYKPCIDNEWRRDYSIYIVATK